MSYAPNPTAQRSRTQNSASATTATRGQAGARGNNGSAARGRGATAKAAAPRSTPRGRPYDETRNWKQLGLLAAGIAAGAAVGARVGRRLNAESGPPRRAGIARKARHLGHDAEQRWEDLAFALREAARSTRDRFRHRHAAADETDVDD